MKRLSILIYSLIAISFSSCNKNDGTTSFIVRLTDSPGDYEAVNIDLQAVQIHTNTGAENDGWETLNSNPGIYDLLTLTNGVESVIADDTYPAGKVSQLRLVLGNNNSVVVDGASYPLTVPSGSETGLKVLINANLVEGITYSVLLDFNAAKSVVKAGAAEKYLLKPVIKAITEAEDGAIKGSVVPAELNVAIYAISGADTLSTSYASKGNADFFLGGLADGAYTISFDPGELSGYQGVVKEDISVAVGKVTDIGETMLEQ
jgi:Domain of unknown function (DUF4382)